MTNRPPRPGTAPRRTRLRPQGERPGALTPRATDVRTRPPSLPEHPADARGYAIAIMSGVFRKGNWEPPARLFSLAFWGGVELDFREADMLEGTTEVQILAIMGGAKVIVPPDIGVEVSGAALMGGFGHVSQTPPDASAPLLRIKGLAIMGGVEVKMLEIGEKDEE